MESLICALHLPKLNKLNKPSPVQACLAWQETSQAELENLSSAWLIPSQTSQAKLARLSLPSLLRMRIQIIEIPDTAATVTIGETMDCFFHHNSLCILL